MSVVFVISTLGSGGAERVVSTMANWWAQRGRPVTILTLDGASSEPFYALQSAVRHLRLGLAGDSNGLWSGLRNNVSRLVHLRRMLARLENAAIISFGTETNCLVLLASLGLRRRVVVSERCDPRFIPRRRVWRWLRHVSYPFASAVVVQTKEVSRYFSDSDRVAVIQNPIARVLPESASMRDDIEAVIPGRPFVLGIGRLVEQKGFDLLISAFALVAASHPEWSLLILGEGTERQVLEEQVHHLGLAQRVRLPGVVVQPQLVFQEADLFVLSSRFEGFPNALCEAMASGLPVIATDCPSGPDEIVRDGVDGVLVPPENAEQLAAAMSRLMGNSEVRRTLGERASEISERLKLEAIMSQWERTLDEGVAA
jgi:glycosyltransferase involved in cell wall biosynthesis